MGVEVGSEPAEALDVGVLARVFSGAVERPSSRTARRAARPAARAILRRRGGAAARRGRRRAARGAPGTLARAVSRGTGGNGRVRRRRPGDARGSGMSRRILPELRRIAAGAQRSHRARERTAEPQRGPNGAAAAPQRRPCPAAQEAAGCRTGRAGRRESCADAAQLGGRAGCWRAEAGRARRVGAGRRPTRARTPRGRPSRAVRTAQALRTRAARCSQRQAHDRPGVEEVAGVGDVAVGEVDDR